jgi:hypothetical protein
MCRRLGGVDDNGRIGVRLAMVLRLCAAIDDAVVIGEGYLRELGRKDRRGKARRSFLLWRWGDSTDIWCGNVTRGVASARGRAGHNDVVLYGLGEIIVGKVLLREVECIVRAVVVEGRDMEHGHLERDSQGGHDGRGLELLGGAS